MNSTVKAPIEEALPPNSSTTDVGAQSSAKVKAAIKNKPSEIHLHGIVHTEVCCQLRSLRGGGQEASMLIATVE